MTKITLDSALRNRLLNLAQPLELCDESGRIDARVAPVPYPNEYVPFVPEFTEEELEHAEKSGKRFTTAEVLLHLESLKCTDFNGPRTQ